jgi:hypothetical protein
VSTNEWGQVSSTNRVDIMREYKGSGARSLFELGLESSFKAFKVLTDAPLGLGHDTGLRHIAEPYADYTFVANAGLEPVQIPQFDAIDALGKANMIQLGMRNRLQTKRDGVPTDLLYTDVYTYYYLEEVNNRSLSDIYLDVRYLPANWLLIQNRLGVDVEDEPGISYYNAQIWMNSGAQMHNRYGPQIGLEYRYDRDAQDLIAGNLIVNLTRQWSVPFSIRYNVRASNMEEINVGAEHSSDCLGKGLYVRYMSGNGIKDDEWQLYFQLWLVALPESRLSVGY